MTGAGGNGTLVGALRSFGNRNTASHDRVATHILAFEGERKVTFFDGIARGAGGDATSRLHSPDTHEGYPI
jgi:hypothetical protein